jgi:hypothetical protein
MKVARKTNKTQRKGMIQGIFEKFSGKVQEHKDVPNYDSAEKEHWCGCITTNAYDKERGGWCAIRFKHICQYHKDKNTWAWIALQHDNQNQDAKD